MVKVEFIRRTALYTLASISHPNLQLDRARNDPPANGIYHGGTRKVFVTFDRDQLEPEYGSVLIAFLPGIKISSARGLAFDGECIRAFLGCWL